MTRPEPGHYYRKNGFEFRVDFVENDEVYLVRWKIPCTELGIAWRVPMAQWDEQMQDAEEVKAEAV